jgi:nucleoporin NUP159
MEQSLGFHAIQGDTMVKLFPNSWPVDSLPPPTADLFAVASRKGFVAAASPDTLVLSKTETIRKAFTSDATPIHTDGSVKILPFSPELSIPLPRLSQVMFNSNEEYLIVCAEEGGGMRVYRTDELSQGKTEAAFQIATNGISVRSLVPNPSPDFSDFVAVVLTGGQLLLADLNERKLVQGENGQVIKEGVSCVSWSVQGKAIVAGMGNGTILQMRASGSLMAEIPRPPGLEGDQHGKCLNFI